MSKLPDPRAEVKARVKQFRKSKVRSERSGAGFRSRLPGESEMGDCGVRFNSAGIPQFAIESRKG